MFMLQEKSNISNYDSSLYLDISAPFLLRRGVNNQRSQLINLENLKVSEQIDCLEVIERYFSLQLK